MFLVLLEMGIFRTSTLHNIDLTPIFFARCFLTLCMLRITVVGYILCNPSSTSMWQRSLSIQCGAWDLEDTRLSQAQSEMEALKAEKERSEEEKQRIAEQLLQQHMELQSHYQVRPQLLTISMLSFCGHQITRHNLTSGIDNFNKRGLLEIVHSTRMLTFSRDGGLSNLPSTWWVDAEVEG